MVPEDSELKKFQPKYIGRQIHELYNGEFQSEYRHCVAHFALDDGGVYESEFPAGKEPVCEHRLSITGMRRGVDQNQEGYFAQFFRGGGII